MGYKVIVVGNKPDRQDLHAIGFLSQDKVHVLKFSTHEQAAIAKQKINQKSDKKAFFYKEYKKIKNHQHSDYIDLPNIEYEDMIKYHFDKNEYFIICNNCNMLLQGVDNEDIIIRNQKTCYGKIYISNTGMFFVNILKSKVEVYVGNYNLLFNDLYFDEVIQHIQFSSKDTYLVVHTAKKTFVYDFFKGKLLRETSYEMVEFDINEEFLYYIQSGKRFNLEKNECCDIEEKWIKIVTEKNKSFFYSDGNVQKINFVSHFGILKKTHANISSISFTFSCFFGLAYITKKVNDNKIHLVEIYNGKTIHLLNLENELINYQISDKYLCLCDTAKRLMFYKITTTGLVLVKSIVKDGKCLISVFDCVVCVFDDTTDNLEFYDNGNLRTVYQHFGCTTLKWSQSGLYISAIANSSGLIQIFNNNGKLIYKRIHNIFDDFIWRPFICLSDNLQELVNKYSIENYVRDLKLSKTKRNMVEKMINEWKDFLIAKKNLLGKN